VNFILKYLEKIYLVNIIIFSLTLKIEIITVIHEFTLIFMKTLFPPFLWENFCIPSNILYRRIKFSKLVTNINM